VTYVFVGEILFINKTWISLFGGFYDERSDNIKNHNSFNFVLDAAKQEVFGAQLYPDVFRKAATYLFYIIKDHIFHDGNKRTGMVTAFLFLARNGIKVTEEVTSKRVRNYAVRIAKCKPTIEHVAKWLRRISVSRVAPHPTRQNYP